MDSKDIQGLIDEMHRYITDVRDNLEKDPGAPIEGMDERVALICQKVAQLDREEAKQFEAGLQGVMEEVELLQKSLETARDATLGTLKNTEKHRKAAGAYFQQSTNMPKHKPDES